MTELHPFGIVAIGRNEVDRLRRRLSSIPRDGPAVCVNSASTDGSATFARVPGAEVVELDDFRPFIAARARDDGCKRLLEYNVRLKYVQFVDGDCEFEDGWLQTAEQFLDTRPEIAVVCGRRRERYPERSFYNRLCDEEWDTQIGEVEASGADALTRLSAFAAVDVYDAALIACEEPELCSRLRQQGWRVWRLDNPMAVHDAAMNHLVQWWRRALRSGYDYSQVWHKTKGVAHHLVIARKLGRAVLWTAGVSAAAISTALVWGPTAVLLAPLAWLLQLTRLSNNHGFANGPHMLIAKAAEFLGATRHALALTLRREKRAIYYK